MTAYQDDLRVISRAEIVKQGLIGGEREKQFAALFVDEINPPDFWQRQRMMRFLDELATVTTLSAACGLTNMHPNVITTWQRKWPPFKEEVTITRKRAAGRLNKLLYESALGIGRYAKQEPDLNIAWKLASRLDPELAADAHSDRDRAAEVVFLTRVPLPVPLHLLPMDREDTPDVHEAHYTERHGLPSETQVQQQVDGTTGRQGSP